MEKLVDLREFRKRNHIKQSDLAEFLDTSASFISLIENGQSKLPESKIDRIMNDAEVQKGWSPEGLVPVFDRVRRVIEYLKKECPIEDTPELERLFLPDNIYADIRYGRIGISMDIAKAIADSISWYFNLNPEWLATGIGDMVLPKSQIDYNVLYEKYKDLLERVERLEQQEKKK